MGLLFLIQPVLTEASVCVWVPVWLFSGSLFLLHFSPSSCSLPFPRGYKEMAPKPGKALGERGPEISLTHAHSASALRKTRHRKKSPPLLLPVPHLACSEGLVSLHLSLLLQLLSSPIFWHQGSSRTGGLEIQ